MKGDVLACFRYFAGTKKGTPKCSFIKTRTRYTLPTYKEAINSIEIMTREHSSFLHPERERGFEQSYCETTLTEQDLYVVALASFMICEFGRKNDEFSDTLIRDIIVEVAENADIALKVFVIVEFDFRL